MVKSKIRRGYRIAKYIVYKETLVDSVENFWSFTGAFLGIGLIAFLQTTLSDADNLFLIGSFGASSVLIFGAIQSPLAQPRNLVGGHLISAILGVTIYQVFPNIIWFTAPLAVSLSILCMQVTKTLHPPGGATALIAVIGSEKIKHLGYWFVLSPVASGVFILLVTAVIFNNLTPNRKYPTSRRFSKTFQWATRPTKRFLKRMKKKHY